MNECTQNIYKIHLPPPRLSGIIGIVYAVLPWTDRKIVDSGGERAERGMHDERTEYGMNIGLILAGGMGKGAYQVGALKAIGRVFQPTDFPYISASSIGAINGYGFSCGQIGLVEEMWRSVNADAENVTVTDFLKSDFLKKTLPTIASVRPAARVFQLPLLTIHTRERKLQYFDIAAENYVARRIDFLRASVAVPLFGGRAVPIDGERYWDGAVVENMPISPMLPHDDDIDFYIAVYFDRKVKFFEDPERNRRTLRLCFDDGTLIKNATCLTEHSVQSMITQGEQEATHILSCLVPDGKPDKSYILERIAELSTVLREERSKWISSSRALSALNGVTRHLLTN